MADDGYEESERSKSEINNDNEVSGLAVPSSEPISKSSKAASPLSYPPVAVRHHLNAYHDSQRTHGLLTSPMTTNILIVTKEIK